MGYTKWLKRRKAGRNLKSRNVEGVYPKKARKYQEGGVWKKT